MTQGNLGILVFIILIVAFVIYIIAAALRNRGRAQPPEAEEPEELSERETDETPSGGFCLHCMARMKEADSFCSACGKPRAAENESWKLSAGTVLADRYTVGVALKENRAFITYIAGDNYLEMRLCVREYFPRELAVRGEAGAVLANEGAESLFADGRKKFAAEIRLMSRMNGIPSATGVSDLFYANGTVYAVTEYAAGRPLSEWVRDNGAFTPEYTLALFAPVIRQLAREEELGYLRCNLTPDSFTASGEGLKLDGVGAPGGRISTILAAGYAPEELYRNSGATGAWTDVYSLCAVIYYCLTGVVPDAAAERTRHDLLRTPSSLGIHVSRAFEESLMKGLRLYREDRFADCGALFYALYRGRAAGAGSDSFFRPIVDPVGPDASVAARGAGFGEPVDNDIE